MVVNMHMEQMMFCKFSRLNGIKSIVCTLDLFLAGAKVWTCITCMYTGYIEHRAVYSMNFADFFIMLLPAGAFFCFVSDLIITGLPVCTIHHIVVGVYNTSSLPMTGRWRQLNHIRMVWIRR
jgi:hypothetical protein